MLRRHDVETGTCPAGAASPARCSSTCSRPASAASPSRRRERRASRRRSRRVFVQDSWQATPNLNVQYGLRWEAQIEPDSDHAAEPGLLRAVHRQDVEGAGVPVERQDPVRLRDVAAAPRHRRGIRAATASSVLRANAGIFYGRVPGLTSPRRARPTAASDRRSSATAASTPILGPRCRPIRTCIPQSQIGVAVHPDVFVFDKNFKNPRTTVGERLVGAGGRCTDYAFLVKYNYAKGDAHHPLHQPQRSAPRLAVDAPASAPAARTASAR